MSNITADFERELAAAQQRVKANNGKVTRFGEIVDGMKDLYEAKNADYGDSFHEGFTRIGPAYAVGRLLDKYNRIENLLLKQNTLALVKDESVLDTLTDLSCYCVMLRMEIENQLNAQSEDF